MSENEFNFTDEEFLDVINTIIQVDKAPGETFIKLENMDQSIGEGQLDSLGTVVFFAWLDQIFQIPIEVLQQFSKEKVYTCNALKEFIKNNCNRSFTYLQAMEFIKKCS